MWKPALRIAFATVLLACLLQVDGGIVQAKKWFQPNIWHNAVERVCRDGAVFASVTDDDDGIPPTLEELGQINNIARIQVALYSNLALPLLPTEEEASANDVSEFSASAYGEVIAAGTLRTINQTTPFTYTQDGSVDGPFYDYTTMQLHWSPELVPGTNVVIEGVTEGLFYTPVQDCYIRSFHYQGYLADAAGPANGLYDFQFAIYDDPFVGGLSSALINKPGVTINNGAYTVELPVATTTFAGTPRWLEIKVKVSGATDYITLSPRQQLLATPYALYAQNTNYANTAGYSHATRGMFVNVDGSSSFQGGIDVHTTATDTITSRGDGFRVCATGSQPCEENFVPIFDPGKNGLEVGNAQNDGVHVIAAGDDGLQIGNDTLGKYPSYGVYIPEPGVPNSALLVETANGASEWALYTHDKISVSNVNFTSLTLIAQVDGAEILTRGDLVAAVGLGNPLPNTTNLLPRVRLAAEQSFNGVIGVVEGRMTLQPEPGKAGVLTLHSAEGPAQAGDYVALTVYGVAQVKPQAVTDAIVPGQRLTAAQQPGTARLLRTETLNGMVVNEGAPVIGIALAPVDQTTGLLPVFVTLK